MAYNTQEERLKVKGSESITRDLQVNQDIYANGNVVSNGLTTNNGVIENGTVNNLGVSNLTGVEATVTDLNVANLVANNAVVEELTVNANLIANGLAGNDGQVLGKVDGKVEWFSPATIDTNDFKVNYLTVNNTITAVDGTFENINVNNLIVNTSEVVNGDVFTHKGFDVTSMTVISESDYNNLGWKYRNSALYMTYPNGNMYFYGIKYAATSMLKNYTAYVDLPNMAYNMQSLTTSTLTFTTGAVTNSFVNGGAYNGIKEQTPFGVRWNNSAPIGTQANTGSIITNASELYITNAAEMYLRCSNLTDTFITNPSLITGAPANYNPLKYCTNMVATFYNCQNFNQPITIPDSVSSMAATFYNCKNFNQPITIPNNVTDMHGTFEDCTNFNQPITIPNNVTDMENTFLNCFSFNQPITILNSVTNMAWAFNYCYKFNQPITIPNSVTNMYETFRSCYNFNQPITISNSVTDLQGTFYDCRNLNQPITIPNSVTSISSTFSGCRNLNQPITIPNSVTGLFLAFNGCSNFNQPITIPDNVTSMSKMFNNCSTLNNSTVPIHISSSIAIGNTSNYIYNCLVNGFTGINWTGRILNDA